MFDVDTTKRRRGAARRRRGSNGRRPAVIAVCSACGRERASVALIVPKGGKGHPTGAVHPVPSFNTITTPKRKKKKKKLDNLTGAPTRYVKPRAHK